MVNCNDFLIKNYYDIHKMIDSLNKNNWKQYVICNI